MNRREAQIRNYKIMRLKGMYATAKNIIDCDLAPLVMDVIDRQLIRMNATTPDQDRAKWRKEHGL